jgi:Septum formation topological specificity factor
MSSFFNKIGKIITPTSSSSSSSSSSSVTSTVRNALYNKSKQQQQQSASRAKERLSLILASQRNSTLLQDVDMQALQHDVLQVLKKYISIVDGGTTRTSTSYNRNNRSSSNTKGSTAGGIMTHPSSSGGVLHCDVKNIPNELRNGEQMTLLEMTVEIDPRQTILLHRQQHHQHRGEGGRGGGLAAREEEEKESR